MRGGLAWLLGVAGFVTVLASVASAPAWGGADLTDTDVDRLGRGEVVVRIQEIDGYPWPEVTVYRRAAATPEEVVAVYADFEGQAGYLPNLVQSRVVTRLSARSFHVSYEYEVAGPNERYTVLATVGRSPGGFRVSWDLLRARYARRLSGQMSVDPFDSGALIEYRNRVDPGFLGVHLGSPETTARQLVETVQALAAHVTRVKVEEPERLATLTRVLRAMLDGQ